MFDFFGKKKNRIAFLIDGPNILRKAFGINLMEIKKELQKYGEIRVAKIYLDQFASEKLIEAVVNQGFDKEITTGDVDVTMAIEGMEYIVSGQIDTLAIMTRDTDYIPVIVKAKARGIKTIVVATDVAFSAALRNTADKVIIFHSQGNIETTNNSE